MAGPDKAALRSELLARRRALPADQASRLSSRILARLRELPAWRSALEVLLYAPVRGEVDVSPLMHELWERGARVLLPRCRPGSEGELDLACCACPDELAPGAFGIPEPDPAACPALEYCGPDVVLVPAVGLDRQGVRLGHGAGYYDRLLARPDLAGALIVAPAYGFQVLDRLPADPWDRPVDVIVTENQTLWRKDA
ncbi:MAG: 5-formyltetrahydrofolate cyclo-ligase [Thermodesulfobacteriota bacterium]